MGNLYVISAELDLQPPEIIRQDRLDAFREDLDADLRGVGKETLWVSSALMRQTAAAIAAGTTLPVVSLDDRYTSGATYYLGISRGVNDQLEDTGYSPRAGYLPLGRQLAQVASLGSEILLADDVVFSGEMVAWLADRLRRFGVTVAAVTCGIATQEGIDKLELEGITVEARNVFGEVEDEICERDFAVVAGSGRRIDTADANALYFDDLFGKPARWASIPPESVGAFCGRSLVRSMRLLNRNVPIETIGNFWGYGRQGNAIDQLGKRLEAVQ